MQKKQLPVISPEAKGGQSLGLTTLPTSFADCLEIWEVHPPRNLERLSRPV